MTGSYNNFFKIFDRSNRRDVTFEASKDIIRPRVPLKPKKVRLLLYNWTNYFPMLQLID